MKANKILLLSSLAFAVNAFAAPVSVDTARLAAGSWALSDAALGVPHGSSAGEAVAYGVDGTNGFYAVSLEGGGTLFLAADDEIDPILAFTASSSPNLSAGSPLLNLLVRDVRARRGRLAAEAEDEAQQASSATPSGRRLSATAGPASAAPADVLTASAARARKLWSAFAPSQASDGRVRLGATATPRSTLASYEIRVAPILTTQWSQTDAGGKICYNYYTPYNYPCGCVATAAGQILNRWKYPTGDLEQFSNACTVNGGTMTLTSTGSPRVYDWDAMVDTPSGATSEASRAAIGALLSDLGISFGAGYTYEGTSAYEFNVPEPLHSKFNYASAYTYTVNGTGSKKSALHTAPVRQRAILANLDAKRPVELYILSDAVGGHAVVADGYGFVTIGGEDVEFTHINMGWAGTDDMWYNLPVIVTQESGSTAGQTGGYSFDYLMGVTFNIHPTETGDILSGRVTDDGDPVEGATVTVYASGGFVEPLATTTTDEYGIYSFTLEGGVTYNVMAVSADGKKSGTLEDALLLKTTVSDTTTYTTHSDSDIGNSWGNDIDIVVPHVRIVGGNVYPNLNSALADAATMDDPIVEIFGPTRLKQPVTITTNITIRTVPDFSADFEDVLPTLDECEVFVPDTAVTSDGWALQIADASRVAFSNIVVRVASGRRPHLDVIAAGKAAFSGRIDIGRVVTRTGDAIVLAGTLESTGAGLLVACDCGGGIGSPFGIYECADDVAGAYAGLIGNALDGTLSGQVGPDGLLVWDDIPIDPSVAVAKATDPLGATRYYRSMDLLFADCASGADVVVLRDCPFEMFTNTVTIARDVSIAGEGTVAPVVSMSMGASFSVKDGARLALENVALTRDTDGSVRSSKKSLIAVVGGGSLELGPGATIYGLQLSGTASAVAVSSGTVAMREGSSISNCVATSSATQCGAAISLQSAESSLEMTGGLVSGCIAGKEAGGISAGSKASICLSGTASVCGNKLYTDRNKEGAYRDVYCNNNNQLSVTGRLEGKVGVYCYAGHKVGNPFAVAGESLSNADAESSVAAFFNNAGTATSPALSGDRRSFMWVATPVGQVPETDADVSVEVDGVIGHYAKIEDAFAVATNGTATITLHRDISLTNSLAAKTDIVFDGCGHTVLREGDFTIAVTNVSLSLANVVLDGGTGTVRFVDVASTDASRTASLTLDSGAVVRDVYGEDQSMVAAIVVWHGTFTILPGAEIVRCGNLYDRYDGGPLAAGAVVVDGERGVARLYGGTIHQCAGSGAGGVYVGNGASAFVMDGVSVRDNESLFGEPCNLVVQDLSSLVLEGEFTGAIGYTEGVAGDTSVFGTVDADVFASTSASNLAASARRFRHDVTEAKGLVATNATEALLVWSSAVGASTAFTNVVEGVTNVYGVVRIAGDEPETVVCEPFAFASIEEVSPGRWRLVLKPGTRHCTYTLKRSDDLEHWSNVGKPKTLGAGDISGAELEFFFEVDDAAAGRFWKVEGFDGTK